VQPLNPSGKITKYWVEDFEKTSVREGSASCSPAGRTDGECFKRHLANTLPEDNRILNSDIFKGYEGIFIKLKTWRAFESSDTELNRVHPAISVPGFVADFERTLDGKPGLACDVRFLDLSVCFSILTGQCRRFPNTRFPISGCVS
jgi:hypothetical protein